MSNSEEAPPGVELYDLDDHASARKRIFDGVKKEFLSVFPQAYGGVRLSVDDVDYADPEEYSVKDQKDALLKDKFLARRLRGKLSLHDDKTGELLDSRDMTLMRVPYLTERGTFIHGGNEYASIMQSRLLPGAYTRRQSNGGLETQFNVRSGTGTAFRVGFEPDTSQYRLRVQQANLHLYSLLHDIGVPDEHLEQAWGKDILAANQRKYDSRVFDKAYARFVPKRTQNPDATPADKTQQIKEALDAARIHGGAARRTLPNMFDLQKAAGWAKQAARTLLEEQFVKNSSRSFTPDFTPDELTDVRNAMHGVGPRLAGMAEWPASWLPEYDKDFMSWWEQHHHGRRTDDDARMIMRWSRFKRLQGDKLRENPTPRRAFALRAWGIDPLKLVDGRSRAKLEREMAAYKTKAEDRHNKEASLSCPCCKKMPSKYRIHGDAIQCGDCKKISDMDAWEKKAWELPRDESGLVAQDVPDGLWWMEKLARYGAGVLFKQLNGKYLLQENGPNDCDDPENVGKLRPAGGGKNKSDHNLRATILREMEEEFDIDPEEAKGKIELLGYINDGSEYDGCALFEMEEHGLKPGTYQASNSKHEKIKLVEASLDDPKYIGSKKLRHFADKRSCHSPESDYHGGNEDFNESAWDERNTGIPGLEEREGQVLQSKQSAFPNIRGEGNPDEPGMAGRLHAVLPGHGASPEAPHAGSGECKQGVLQGELQVASAGGTDAEHDAKPENNIQGENSVLDGLVKKIGNLVQRAAPEIEKLAAGGSAEHQGQRQAGDIEKSEALHLERKVAHTAPMGKASESFSFSLGGTVKPGMGDRSGAREADKSGEAEPEKMAHLERKDANSGAVGEGDGVEKGLSVSPPLQIRMVTGGSSDDAAGSGTAAQSSQTRVKSAYDYFDFSEDHPGNKEASEDEDYECPHCHEAFDYNDQPEKCMGTVACPHCKKFVPQDGKKHRVLVRFTRFEIHKLAKMSRGSFQEALDASSVPGDVQFFTSGILNRCQVSTGDWHSEEVAKAAEKLAREYFADVECDSEVGRPAWAEKAVHSYNPSKDAAAQPGPAAWNFDEGILTDQDSAKLKDFADTIHRDPQPWQKGFQPEPFINDYANKGHEAMTVRPYGADLLPWIAQARRAYGVFEPNSPFAWKGDMISPSPSTVSGIDFNSPGAKPFVEMNPDGTLKGVQQSALHYLAFQTSPAAAYRQMWNEFDAPTNEHVAMLLDNYQQRHPQFDAGQFDKFVSHLDPEFYKHKQMIDARIGKDMRPTAQVYADIADKALGWDKALEKPKVAPPPNHLPAIAAGAAGLGAAGLAYWLWQRNRKKKQQEKQASAVQLQASEARHRQVLEDLKKAKEHSDKKEYGQKSVIMTRLFRDHPDDFIMDDDWNYAGVTHVPSGFRLHVPRNTVPAEIATSPLTKVWQRRKSEEFKRLDLGGADVLEDMAHSPQRCLRDALAAVKENPSWQIQEGPAHRKGDTRHFWAAAPTGAIHDPSGEDYPHYQAGKPFDVEANKDFIAGLDKAAGENAEWIGVDMDLSMGLDNAHDCELRDLREGVRKTAMLGEENTASLLLHGASAAVANTGSSYEVVQDLSDSVSGAPVRGAEVLDMSKSGVQEKGKAGGEQSPVLGRCRQARHGYR